MAKKRFLEDRYKIMGLKFKPTLDKTEITSQGKKYETNFKNTMNKFNVKNLNEVDELLTEKEQSLKKKIFSLAKMEALVFPDPKLSAIYDEMAENGEEKYGYHYNETIMNMIFNDYVLNSPVYLQKYKMAIPKEKKRRDSSGINQLKKAGKEKMDKSNVTTETTGAGGGGAMGGGSGQYSQALDYENKVDETTTSASSGQYTGPAMWGSGDLMKTKGKSKVKTIPIVKGGIIIQEEKINYLIDPTDFERYINGLDEQINIENPGASQKSNVTPYNNSSSKNKIKNDTSAFNNNSIDQWDEPDTKLQLHTINKGTMDEPNTDNKITDGKIVEAAKSVDQQQAAGIAYAAKKGEIPMNKLKGAAKEMVKMSKEDLKDFASTKHEDLPEKVSEDAQSMISDNPDTMALNPTPVGSQGSGVEMGMNSGGGMSESYELLEEINNELNAFSIHHNKLKRMAEDRKPSSLVLKDRLGNDNKANFKKDLKDSSISKLVDIENALEYDDQQTEVGRDPYKLGQDIEKNALKVGDMKSGEALKNVGNSANNEGDEIPKRNLSKEEQDEVNKYRLGLGDFVYDNEPGERFEERMKKDMGEKLYKERQEKLKFREKAPMYNKDTQPIDNGIKKVQFNKDKSGWNNREGIQEAALMGKYFDLIGKKNFIDFNLNEVKELNESTSTNGLFEISLEGLGNTYTSKVDINESFVKAKNKFKFFTDGKNVFALKNKSINLTEGEQKDKKQPMNEQYEKMKHLLNFNSNTFVDTKNIKKNRGF